MVNWVAPDKHPSMLEMLPELVTPEYVTLEGIEISFSNVPVNTLYPIDWRLLGSSIVESDVQLAKTKLPILVMESLNCTFSSLVQPENALFSKD